MTLQNSKQEPTPIEWTEEPNVKVETHWVREDGEVSQRKLINANGVLLTFEDAEKVRVALDRAIHGDKED